MNIKFLVCRQPITNLGYLISYTSNIDSKKNIFFLKFEQGSNINILDDYGQKNNQAVKHPALTFLINNNIFQLLKYEAPDKLKMENTSKHMVGQMIPNLSVIFYDVDREIIKSLDFDHKNFM